MDYEMMVKEAYEEIMGFDKEAGDWTREYQKLSRPQQSAVDRIRKSPNVKERIARLAAARDSYDNRANNIADRLSKVQNAISVMQDREERKSPGYRKLLEMSNSLSKNRRSALKKYSNLESMINFIQR